MYSCDVTGLGELGNGIYCVLCGFDAVFFKPLAQKLELALAPVELSWILNYSIGVGMREEEGGIKAQLLESFGPAEYVVYTLF